MADLTEQCYCIRFYFKLEKTATGTFGKFKVVFRDQTMGRDKFLNAFPISKTV
jgi:hypothetical protein